MEQRLVHQADSGAEKGGGFSVPTGVSTANPLEGSGPGAHDDPAARSSGFTLEGSLAKTLSSSHTEQEQRNLGE